MRYQSNWGILLADQDSVFLQVHTQGFQILFLWLNKYHVGEALDWQAFNVTDAFSKLPGPVMIIDQSSDIMLECIQATGRQHPGLAHAAGYRKVLQCADIARLSEAFAKALQQDGPIFVDLRVEHEGEIPLDYDALFSAERRRLFKTELNRA